MAIAAKLAEQAREGSAGASSYRGFTYQHHWTLCKLLDVHEEGSDYLVLVDHHDDVVVWPTPPDGLLRCFQVKGKARGNWTTNALLKRKSGAMSILGKLYHHRLFFEDGIEGLEFVSNARFSLGSLSDGSDPLDRMRIECTELSPTTAEAIRAALRDEHQLTQDPEFEGLVCFERATMPVEAYREHTLGRVADFLERASGGAAVRSRAAYQALMDEVERRASLVATAFPGQEALRRKSLDRHTVQEMFDEILTVPPEQVWPSIEAGLVAAGYGPVKVAGLRGTYRTLAARRTGPEWQFIDDLVAEARRLVMALDDDATLHDCLALIVPRLRRDELAVGLSHAELEVIVMESLYVD